MKKLIIFSFFIVVFFSAGILSASAQHSAGDKNRTYYDAAKTKLKEVYMTSEMTVMNPDDVSHPSILVRKNGPYFYYYENGKVKISGEYKDDEKCGTWTYRDESGTITKTEKYVGGKVVE